MSLWLCNLGLGAALAWLSLPLVAWLGRERAHADAASLHRSRVSTLVCAVALLTLPWLKPFVPVQVFGPSAYAIELRSVSNSMTDAGAVQGEASAWTISPLAIVGSGWLLAVAVAAAKNLVSWLALRRVLAQAIVAPRELVDAVTARARAMVLKTPRVLVSEHSAIPFVARLLEPTIVLPFELVQSLDAAAMELVLEHELEHIRRRDVKASAFVALLKTALGNHPTAQRIAREAALAREIAVDWQMSRRDPRAYASLLVDIATHAHFGEKPAPTAIDDSALARRIALISEPIATRPLSSGRVWCAGGAIALAAFAAPSVVAASPPPLLPRDVLMAGAGSFPRNMLLVGPGSSNSNSNSAATIPPALPFLLERSAAVHDCYARAAQSNPALFVHATFELSGEANKIKTATVRVGDAPLLQQCLEQAAAALTIEPPSAAAWTALVALALTPESMRPVR